MECCMTPETADRYQSLSPKLFLCFSYYDENENREKIGVVDKGINVLIQPSLIGRDLDYRFDNIFSFQVTSTSLTFEKNSSFLKKLNYKLMSKELFFVLCLCDKQNNNVKVIELKSKPFLVTSRKNKQAVPRKITKKIVKNNDNKEKEKPKRKRKIPKKEEKRSNSPSSLNLKVTPLPTTLVHPLVMNTMNPLVMNTFENGIQLNEMIPDSEIEEKFSLEEFENYGSEIGKDCFGDIYGDDESFIPDFSRNDVPNIEKNVIKKVETIQTEMENVLEIVSEYPDVDFFSSFLKEVQNIIQ